MDNNTIETCVIAICMTIIGVVTLVGFFKTKGKADRDNDSSE